MTRTYLFTLALMLFTFSDAHAFGKKPVNPDPPPAPAPQPPKPNPPKPTPPPAPNPGVPLETSCPAPGVFQAVDMATPVDQRFLDAMKQLKVNTVIRYYDWVNETIRGKTVKQNEVDLLARNGFDLMVVFQHNNNNIASFTAARGTTDANRSVQLASSIKQEKGSAIYFGVDGSWSSATQITAIKAYFQKAGPIVRGAGFKIGAYGSGKTCTELLNSGLADYCWLANATGWTGYSTFKATNRWTMVQTLPKNCGGKNVDFNTVNTAMRDIGSWRP